MKMLWVLFISLFCFSGLAETTVSEPEMEKTVVAKSETELAPAEPAEAVDSQTETIETAESKTETAEAVDSQTETANLTDSKDEPEALRELSMDEEAPSRRSRFLDFGLEYPINFGIHLRYLVSENIYARLGLGFMPSFFLDSFEKISPSFGYLNEEEAKLISDTFENSMYIDFRLAWSPYLKESGGGPYIELGLSRILYGKGELSGGNLNKVIDNGTSFDNLTNYSAKTNTYNTTVHIGYQIPLEKVKLNIEVGLIKILHTDILSETSLTASTLLNDSQQKSFKEFLEKKGWIFPTVSGWISFAF